MKFAADDWESCIAGLELLTGRSHPFFAELAPSLSAKWCVAARQQCGTAHRFLAAGGLK
jgi:hypothetical protein